jgi:hypothetical protein
LLLVATGALLASCSGPIPEQTQILGDAVPIDRLYPPGQGPVVGQEFTLLELYPRHLWLTGVDVKVKDDKSGAEVDGILAGLTIGFRDPERHRKLNKLGGPIHASLFHPRPGLLSIRLPKGYGIPLRSNETLHVSSLWQNRDLYRPPLQARTDVTLHFQSDTAKPPLKALRVHPIFATVPAESAGSTPVQTAGHPRLYDAREVQTDAEGRLAGGRWWVTSGRSEVRSVISHTLPADSELTVRLATAFTYDDWSSLELFDLTAGKSLLHFDPTAPLAQEFPNGLTVDTRHHLELRAVYNNPSPANHVGVGMIVLYADAAEQPGL